MPDPSDLPALPQPVSTTEVLLTAIVQRLDALAVLLQPGGPDFGSPPPRPERRPRKRAPLNDPPTHSSPERGT